MNTSPAVYRTPNGNTYIQLGSGAFHVVRLDGGVETRYTLPASAVELVPSSVVLELA